MYSEGNHNLKWPLWASLQHVCTDTLTLICMWLQELEIYSYQFKSAATIFTKDQCALSGKVGGMRDDMAIALQLAVYWTSIATGSMVE
jgi:hypothetical protein